MTMTGETTCAGCGDRILMVRARDTGRLLALDAKRTDGGWEPVMGAAGLIVAGYVAKGADKRERNGHHAHKLRCRGSFAGALAESRRRIDHATTEWMPPIMLQPDVKMLPVMTPSGVRALVGASS